MAKLTVGNLLKAAVGVSPSKKAEVVRHKISEQRARISALRAVLRNQRNPQGRARAARQLHKELLKLQHMIWVAKGQKHKSAGLIAVRGTRLAPVGSRNRTREVYENYVDYLLWSKGLAPRRHRFPPFNVNVAEAKAGLTPALRQAALETIFIARGKRGQLQGKEILAFQSMKPSPVPQKDAGKVIQIVQEMTETANVPTSRATDAAPSPEKIADSSIPADPAALTDTDVDKVIVDAEATEATIAATGEVPEGADDEVAEAADKPADEVVAEAKQAAVAAGGGGINLKTLGIGAAVAAGVYFLVLKK